MRKHWHRKWLIIPYQIIYQIQQLYQIIQKFVFFLDNIEIYRFIILQTYIYTYMNSLNKNVIIQMSLDISSLTEQYFYNSVSRFACYFASFCGT